MLDAVCETCEKKEPYEPTAWFHHIVRLYELRRGGYPFRPDDLTIDEWLDIGVLKDYKMMEQLKYMRV